MPGNIMGAIALLEDSTYGLEAIKDKLDDVGDSILTKTETGGTLTTDGTEQWDIITFTLPA